MSRTLIRALMLGALIASALITAATASATNWTSNGPLSYTAIAPAAKIAISSSSGPTIGCTAASLSGSVNGPVGPVNTGPWNSVASSTPGFTSCTLGGLPVSFTCTSFTLAQFNALSQTGGPSGPVHGTLTSINCVGTVAGCTFQMNGSVNVTYDNLGHFTINLIGQGLSLTWPNTPACTAVFGVSGSAPGTLSSAGGSALQYTVSGGTIPFISRN
jgi:hypothetical protein